MAVTTDVTTTLVHMECGECHTIFAVSRDLYRQARETGRSWYCPNGHCRAYTRTEIQELRDQLAREQHLREQAQAEADHKRGEVDRIGRRLTATRGVVTRIKNRVGHGVCPCCKRTFQNLQRHMVGKHPAFVESTSV